TDRSPHDELPGWSRKAVDPLTRKTPQRRRCESPRRSLLNDRRRPAVEVYRAARDVAGPLGHEESHQVGELLGLAQPPNRDALAQLPPVGVEVAVLGPPGELGALGDAETHGVDENAVGRVLEGQRLGEVDAGGPGHA